MALSVLKNTFIEAKPPDKSGSVSAMRNTFLLFIDPYALITGSSLALELGGPLTFKDRSFRSLRETSGSPER